MEKFLNYYSDSIYYQDYQDLVTDYDYSDFLFKRLNKNYYSVKSGMYVSFIREGQLLPIQGWKIHISAILSNAKDILKIVAQLANEFTFSFKVMPNEQSLWFSTQKAYSREQAGKFVTIYAKDTTAFKQIISRLYHDLRYFEGPFILTDKRYKDCKVLYYRFGAFEFIPNLNIGNTQQLCILSPTGEFLEDRREPQYNKPSFVEEPFDELDKNEGDSYLFKTYYDIEALKFSNSGGVYLAKNQLGCSVILKEARPFTCLSLSGLQDSIDRRRNEVEFLEKFSNVEQFPKLYDSFYEWEHYFIVEEYIEGKTLKEFSIANNPFLNQGNRYRLDRVSDYIITVLGFIKEIKNVLSVIHQDGYILGDLSLENIVVVENGLKFIDLESVFRESDIPEDVLLTYPTHHKGRNSAISLDYEMMGYVLYDLIFPKVGLKQFGMNYLSDYLLAIIDDFGLNKNIFELWNVLVDFDTVMDMKRVDDLISDIIRNPIAILKNLPCTELVTPGLIERFKEEQIELLDCFILKSQKIYADYSNPLSLGTGVAGTLFNLEQVTQSKDSFLDRYSEWLMVNYLNSSKGDIGLFNGDGGIALLFLKRKPEFAKSIVLYLETKNNIQIIRDYSFAKGSSGYGMLLLKMWMCFNDNSFLSKAVEIGNEILKNHQQILDDLRLGLMDGQTGVALFLLYLSLATKDSAYIKIGKKILKNVLRYTIEVNSNIGVPEYKESTIAYPYLSKGLAGVTSVLLRYYLVTKDIDYKNKISNFISSLNIKYSVSSGLFDGLAGIGHLFIDLCHYLEDDYYQSYITDIRQGILLQMVEKQGRHFFPNLMVDKIDASFAFGIGGIVTFLQRSLDWSLENPIFFCDDLLHYKISS